MGKAAAFQRQQPCKEKQICTGRENRPPAVPMAHWARKEPGLLSFSREVWFSLMQRVNLPWNKSVRRHRGTTDPLGELARSSFRVPPSCRHQSEVQLATGHLTFTAGDGTEHNFRLKGEKCLFPVLQKGSTRVEVSCWEQKKSEATGF